MSRLGGGAVVAGTTRRTPHAHASGLTALLLACTLVANSPAKAASAGRDVPSIDIKGDRASLRPRSDPVGISVTSSEDANVTVTVAHGGGGPDVITLAEAAPVLAGVPLVLTWNGTDDAGAAVPDDRYVVSADGEGLGGTAAGKVSVWVDTRAPTAAWRSASPEPLTGTGSIRLTLDLADSGAPDQPLDVKLRVADQFGRIVRRTDAVRQMPGTATITWDGRDAGGRLVPNGLYALTTAVRDVAGNSRDSRVLAVRLVRPVQTHRIYGIANAGDRVALTFDDCGSSAAWRSILGTLKRTNADGTIFCSGYRVAAEPRLARRTVAQGVPVGNHGWDHPTLTGLSDNGIRSQLTRTSAAWWRVAHVTPIPYFRPPYGATNSRVERIAGQLGYRYTALWNVDPRDWSGISSAQVVHNVLSASRSGSIVVMHMKSATAQALPAIIAGLRKRGLQPVSLPVLIAAGR